MANLEDIDQTKLGQITAQLAAKHLHARGVALLENNWAKYQTNPEAVELIQISNAAYAKHLFTLGFISGAIGKFR